MKTLNIAILVVLIGVFIVLCIQNVYAIPYMSTQDLYKQSYIVLYGKVIAKDSSGSDHYNYQIRAEQYFKNLQTSDSITVMGQKMDNGTHLTYPQFEVGDMAIFYVDKIQGTYVISPYSTKAGDACDIHAFLGPKPILGEPVMRGPPNPLVLTDENGGRIGMIPVGHPVIIKYALANNYPSSRNYTMDISIQKENDTAIVFHKTQTIEVDACGYSEDALKWNFVPMQSGNFTVNAILDGNLTASASLEINKTNLSNNGNSVSSPLKQFKSGIKAQDVKCNTGFILVLKQDYAPACIKEPSAIKLFLRGWIFGFADYQPVYFMKHNIHAEISVKYSPSNHGSMSSDLLDLYPRAYSKTNSNYPTDAIYANTNPDMISQNAETVVKYTIMAQNNTRGVYWLSLDSMCELVPIAVDVDKSDLTISDLQSPATAWKCPGSTMQYNIISVSGVTVGLVPIRN